MDFLSGRLGTPQGFEPFFDDVFQLGSLSEDTIEELRILAGTTTLVGPRLDLGMILRDTPPTKTNSEMLAFALKFDKHPSLFSFLMTFVSFQGTDLRIDEKSMVRAYLATDRGMSQADRFQIYKSISDYLYSTSTMDATKENMKLRTGFPDGLIFTVSSAFTEGDWKKAIDSYWGIKRSDL